MEILNLISYGSAVLFFGIVLVFDVAVVVASIYSLFQKKIKGGILAKLFIVFVSIGLCPWIIRIMFFFLTKMGV